MDSNRVSAQCCNDASKTQLSVTVWNLALKIPCKIPLFSHLSGGVRAHPELLQLSLHPVFQTICRIIVYLRTRLESGLRIYKFTHYV
jgi:hypothetical protein